MDTFGPLLIERCAGRGLARLPRTTRLAERCVSATAATRSEPRSRRIRRADEQKPIRRRGRARRASWWWGPPPAGRPRSTRCAGAARGFPGPDPRRPAHAGELHGAARPPARPALRAEGRGGHAGPSPLRPGNVYVGRGDADLIVGARRSAAWWRSARQRSPSIAGTPASIGSSISAMQHVAPETRDRHPDDGHGQRRRGEHGGAAPARRPHHRGGGGDRRRLGHAGRAGPRRGREPQSPRSTRSRSACSDMVARHERPRCREQSSRSQRR